MIKLSQKLSSYLCNNYYHGDNRYEFEEKELNNIKKINISRDDIEFLKYFKNIEVLELDSFPSVQDDDIRLIASLCPKIKTLKIKEQNLLFKLDVSYFKELKELCVIHNDNLISIVGIRNLDRITIYDNKEYDNIKQFVDYISYNKELMLDITYYVDIVRYLNSKKIDRSVLNNVKWIESLGIRKFSIEEYSTLEVKELFNVLTDIVSRYVYINDNVYEKFGILHEWMLKNITFVNEDVPKKENINNFNTVKKVYSYMKAGRLTYAKAFQLLLKVAGIKTKIVYSMGAYECIGYYDGKKVYSLFGKSDYALLRIEIDNRCYYTDIAWNAMTKDFPYADKLRMFLISKEDLKIRQKFVGEGNIVKSYSYHPEQVEELILYANDRIAEVNKMFDDIEKNKSIMTGLELNCSCTKSKIKELEDMINKNRYRPDEITDINYSISSYKELENKYLNDIREYKNIRNKVIEKYRLDLIRRYKNDIDLKDRLDNYDISLYLYELVKDL